MFEYAKVLKLTFNISSQEEQTFPFTPQQPSKLNCFWYVLTCSWFGIHQLQHLRPCVTPAMKDIRWRWITTLFTQLTLLPSIWWNCNSQILSTVSSESKETKQKPTRKIHKLKLYIVKLARTKKYSFYVKKDEMLAWNELIISTSSFVCWVFCDVFYVSHLKSRYN